MADVTIAVEAKSCSKTRFDIQSMQMHIEGNLDPLAYLEKNPTFDLVSRRFVSRLI
ncbi:MAG: hypothetical protein ACYC64_03825 [Armatimonadota bacterium]